jgi:hypothetical protein
MAAPSAAAVIQCSGRCQKAKVCIRPPSAMSATRGLRQEERPLDVNSVDLVKTSRVQETARRLPER